MTRTSRNTAVGLVQGFWFGCRCFAFGQGAPIRLAMAISFVAGLAWAPGATRSASAADESPNQVLEWNQIFIDTLIATNTANSSSQRLGAIVHTAIFDAFNGIERRYAPVFVHESAPPGASRRAAVIAAAYTALVGLFPSRQAALAESYAASLAALSDDGEDRQSNRASAASPGEPRSHRPCSPGARPMGSLRAIPAFSGGTAVGQWRPTPPAFGPMSAQGLAFTSMFVLVSNPQFDPRTTARSDQRTYADDFNAVKALGRRTGSTRTEDQTALAPFWEGNASVHWNQAANQIARANHLSMSASNRLLAVLNIAMADTAFTTWSAQAILRRRADRSDMAAGDRDSACGHRRQSGHRCPIRTGCRSSPRRRTRNIRPDIPASTARLRRFCSSHFDDEQTFTLTTTGQPNRTYTSIAQARSDGNNARVWGGMHYPSTVAISDAAGEAIANYVNLNAMQRQARQ